MSIQYGVTPTGFVTKQQSVIISEVQTALQGAFGQKVNLLATSVFGQLVGTLSAPAALLWQLGEALYASRFTAGAEGASVDNLLSLNNLQRPGAIATITAPTDTSGTPGLVLYGTPGTTIPAGSIISESGQPSVQFTLDASVTINPAVNCVQTIYFSNVPTTGSLVLQIVDPFGNTLTLPTITSSTTASSLQSTPGLNNGINTLFDGVVSNYPYTDVLVTGSLSAGFTLTFGGYNNLSPSTPNPPSGGQAQSLITILSNSLQDGSVVTNVTSMMTTVGAVPQAIGSATCTVTGPVSVPAGFLTVIGSPISGWASVTNPLDCIVGQNIDTDTEALQFRSDSLAENAGGTLDAIIEKVSALSVVLQCVGSENTSSVTVGGLPPNSFALIIDDGNNSANNTLIANTILSVKSAGIQSYGSTVVTVNDKYGNPVQIGFTRPTQVPIYVSIVLVTDLLTSSSPQFNVSTIPTIQQDIVTIGGAFKINGTVIGFGSNGLIGAFNSVLGITSYTLYFGTSMNPSTNTNVVMSSGQVPQFEIANIQVSYT